MEATRETQAIESIRRAITDLREAINSGDGARVFQLTADDFEIMPPGQASLSGTAAREFLSGMVTAFDANLEPFRNEEIVVSGEWAWQRYTYELTLTPRAGGDPVTERGDGLHIFRLDTSGRWRLAKDVFTSIAAAAGG